MAIYHASTQSISRSAGRSAVAAAAYRAGVELADERTGLVHDYTRRENGGIASAEAFLPDGTSADRGRLWNAAEQAEKRKDSRTAREWVVALPDELDEARRHALAHDFAGQLAERYGVAVDVAIHRPGREGDHRNHHAHILTTTRQVSLGENGEPVLGGKAAIELSDTKRRTLGLGPVVDEISALRQAWEQTANRHLERAGREERIDRRSLKAQGLERAPTTHLGPHVTQMERRGIATERGDRYRARQALNARIVELAEVRRHIEADAPEQPMSHRERVNAAVADVMRRHLAEQIQATRLARTGKEPATPDPQTVRDEWQHEKTAQFRQVAGKAGRLHGKALGQMERQEKKIAAHDRAQPTRPRGLFAGLKTATYEKAADAWRGVRAGLERRLGQLHRRVDALARYARQAGPYERPTPGERLAEKKAGQARPELAANYRQLIEREKQERQREKEQRRADLLEQFKDRARRDKENERGGQGR